MSVSHLSANIRKKEDRKLLNYHLSTEKGMSGAPILCLDQKGRIFVIGVHTGYKKNDIKYNHGLFLSKMIIDDLRTKMINGIPFDCRSEKECYVSS